MNCNCFNYTVPDYEDHDFSYKHKRTEINNADSETWMLDEIKVQDGEAKSRSQLPLDFVKENMVVGFDGTNPTSLQNAPPKIHSSTTTDI